MFRAEIVLIAFKLCSTIRQFHDYKRGLKIVGEKADASL